MRLPVVHQISTKDGTTNKNARLFNMLHEKRKAGDLAVIRPGLVDSNTYSGLGSGLIVFDGRLLTIYDDTVYIDEGAYSEEWPLDSSEYSATTTYTFGDSAWYLGVLYFSTASGNAGNTPGTGSSYWATSWEPEEWDAGSTYAIGDIVTYSTIIYYSYSPSNTGNNPSTSPQWSTTAPTASRYRVNSKSIAALNATTPGPECASRAAAASAWFGTATTFISCATKSTGNWVTYYGIEDRGGFGVFVRVNQWTDPTPFDCSGSPTNMGVVDAGTIVQTV